MRCQRDRSSHSPGRPETLRAKGNLIPVCQIRRRSPSCCQAPCNSPHTSHRTPKSSPPPPEAQSSMPCSHRSQNQTARQSDHSLSCRAPHFPAFPSSPHRHCRKPAGSSPQCAASGLHRRSRHCNRHPSAAFSASVYRPPQSAPHPSPPW